MSEEDRIKIEKQLTFLDSGLVNLAATSKEKFEGFDKKLDDGFNKTDGKLDRLLALEPRVSNIEQNQTEDRKKLESFMLKFDEAYKPTQEDVLTRLNTLEGWMERDEPIIAENARSRIKSGVLIGFIASSMTVVGSFLIQYILGMILK